MSRLFWLAAGVTIGVLVVRKAQQTAQQLTPGSVAGRFLDLGQELADAIREFGADVREGMAEREAELRTALGLEERLDEPATDAR